MGINFIKLTKPSPAIVDVFNRWENDPDLVYLTRPNQDQSELERQEPLTLEALENRLKHQYIYLIYDNDYLIGEMNYMIDPSHLYRKVPGTGWLGITIGESDGRGKGIGYTAIQYLEKQMKAQGLKRIELGVFEFNKAGQKLYQRLGYKQIGLIKDFTYYQGSMWSDIRMEKYL
ncbi:GNAT family N-acetyltransferase [Virgibacillus halodenitrificans]|uniref:GNAT family N-acetyltransferase n=1 Tax=Virgibacillus halodenitrificans TaxID=1482 RepID=A0AAC9IXS0_VIRHA|nr:GNAT family protein [Virgibacillus halodenitrificans]APC47597.1 GNAT family N-acetyltransferase [Virgibacillus halodenitrificans]MCG1028531.1 GNAT family N-acetyltransferase [Virgibacillus halodenitrificans]